LEKEAPAVRTHPGARPTERGLTVDKASIEYGDARDQDHPHACWSRYVYIGFIAIDEETGDEVGHIAAVPCRRCAEAREDACYQTVT